MKTICFWLNHLGERGMCVSVYDYAYYNQTLLGNKSIILYNINDYTNDNDVMFNFVENFETYGIAKEDIEDFAKNAGCDLLYILKHGQGDDLMHFNIPTAIHAVFEGSVPHGNAFAVISDDVNNAFGAPVVPHMIALPDHTEDMREELGIPKDALVMGRYGGYEQFNMPYTQHVVNSIAGNRHRGDVYFLFMNTQPFCEERHNIIHVEKTIDKHQKVKFINTCDAMIWGRSGGETFGLSIGEFSSKNKPVFCADIGSRAHINILGDKAKIYENNGQLYHQLIDYIDNFQEDKGKDWNAYTDFTPEKVMQQFKKVFLDFLDPVVEDGPCEKIDDKESINDTKDDDTYDGDTSDDEETEEAETESDKEYDTDDVQPLRSLVVVEEPREVIEYRDDMIVTENGRVFVKKR
jgi:hypothetical protein